MNALLLVIVVIVGTAAPLLLVWALYQGFIGEWERYSTGQRRRFVITLLVTGPVLIGVTVALILLAPTGK
jgi:hypothetical protein